MHKFTLVSLFIFLSLICTAQVGSRRIHTDANPYRDSYQRVSCGGEHTLEIRNGALWAYGYGAYGQLGDSSTGNQGTALQIGSATNWMMLSAGESHSLGLQSDGSLWAWGYDGYGQLGDGGNTNVLTPERIGSDSNWISVSAGGTHSLAIKGDGTLWAWGDNLSGQLGNGAQVNQNTPIQVGTAHEWIAISAGANSSYAIASDGTLWGWGDNSYGQLGNSGCVACDTMLQIGAGYTWASIAGGGGHALALQPNGTLWAWGYDGYGQLGDGGSANQPAPVQIGNANNWVMVAAGMNHSLAVRSDGSLWAWGDNAYGQIGDSSNVNQSTPLQIATSNKWVAVSAGDDHSFALSANGLLNGWGRDSYGQLADGSNINKSLPELVSSVINWVKIAPGANHTLALRSDGTLWGWGNNNQGDIGDSTGVTRFSPVQVYGNAKWVNCRAGIDFSLGIQQDGTLWAWGDNYYGQLGTGGTGGTAFEWAPVQISSTTDWVGLAAGGNHSMALKANGTIWTWGDNSYGELGRSNGGNATPQQMADSNWIRIAAGGSGGNTIDQSHGINSSGQLWAWGANSVGQLGTGTGGGAVPAEVGTGTNWVMVSDGQGFGQAIKADGSLWGFGGNSYGEVGNGGNVNNNVPQPVGIDTGVHSWICVNTGTLHAVGLRTNGSLWAWGYGFSGQIGNGGTGNEGVPVPTIAASGWGEIGGGIEANSSIALEPDRITYCATGAGYGGMLGNGSNASRTTYGCTTLQIAAPPVAAFVANPLAVCVGNPVTFTDQSTGTPTAWNWTFTGGTPDSSITKTQVVTYNTPGSYTAKLVVTNTSGSDSLIKISYITVSPPPVVTISPTDTSVCAGSPVTLTATGATDYLWSPTIWLNNINGPVVSASPDSSITYSAICFAGGCVDTASVSIHISPLPFAGLISAMPDTICAGVSAALTLTGSAGNIQWQSSFDGISFIGVAGDSSAAYSADSNVQTTYYRIDASNTCGTDTSPIFKLVVNPLPVPLVTTNDSLICSGDSTMVQTSTTYSSYLWNDADTGYYTYASSAGGYWVIVTDVNGCTAISGHQNISVYSVPSVSIVVLGDTLSSFNSTSYQWFENGTSIPGANSAVYIARDTGNYEVQIVDTNGCKTLSNPVYVTATTGINEITSGNQLSVYPNPNSAGSWQLEITNDLLGAKLEVYNDEGQIIFNSVLRTQSSKLELNVPAGVYYLRISSGTISAIKKLIKL